MLALIGRSVIRLSLAPCAWSNTRNSVFTVSVCQTNSMSAATDALGKLDFHYYKTPLGCIKEEAVWCILLTTFPRHSPMSSLDVRSKQAPPCTNGTASKNELPKAADRAQSVKSSSDKQPKSKILNTSGILRLVSVSALVAFASWIFSIAKEGKPILLPESYALCSPNGQNIYTVDDHNTKVQCMLINRTRIIATGSLREYSLLQGGSNILN